MRVSVVALLVTATLAGGTAAVVHGLVTAHSDPSVAQPRPLRGDANLLLATDITAPTGVLARTWSQYELSSEPTLVCQGNWLTDLGQSTVIFRKYQTEAGHGVAAPVVREAVLEFDSKSAADNGYRAAASWLASCPATLAPPAVKAARPLRTLPAPVHFSVGTFAGVHQETTILGSAYDDFVGLSGTRLLAFEYSRRGIGGDRSVNATVAKAAMRAAQ